MPLPLPDSTRDRLLLIAALILHVLLVGSLFFGYLDSWFHDSARYRRGIDFFSVYQAGDAAAHGRSLYEWPNAADVPYSLPFRYLPFVAYALALPSQILPARAAYWMWVLVIEAAVVMGAAMTYRARRGEGGLALGAPALWFVATPLYLELYMGQFSLVMAVLAMAGFLALARERIASATAWWGLSVLIKISSAILWPVFARPGRWMAIVAAAAAVTLLNAPHFIAQPGDARLFWDENFGSFWDGPSERIAAVYSGNLGLKMLLTTTWLGIDGTAASAPRWLTIGSVTAVLLMSALATLAWRNRSLVVLFALWASAYFLVYSEVWEHHYTMLLPALALLVLWEPRLRPVALAVFVLIALPTPYALFQAVYGVSYAEVGYLSPELHWPRWASIAYHASKVLPTFVLWAACCAACMRHDPAVSVPAEQPPRPPQTA